MKIDWDQEWPSSSECREYLKQNPACTWIDSHEIYSHPMLDAMRKTVLDGEVKFGLFSISLPPDLEWFVVRNRYHELHFFEQFLCSPAFCAAFPDVPPYPLPDELLKCNWSSSYEFAGQLAWNLMGNAPFGNYEGTGKEAMALAQSFANGLFQERYEDVRVFQLPDWSDWFFEGVSEYNRTWVGVDLKDERLWLLFQTNDT